MSDFLESILGFGRRHPYVATNLVLALLLGVGNYFLWQQRTAVTRQHEQVRRNGEDMLRALTDYTRITSDLAAVNQALDLIDHNLVVEGDLEVNLGYFYQMETLSRVRLRQLNQLAAPALTDGNPFKAIPFSLQAAGSYPQLVNFLRNLETGPRLLRVTSYSFSRGDPKTNAMLLDLNVETLGSQ